MQTEEEQFVTGPDRTPARIIHSVGRIKLLHYEPEKRETELREVPLLVIYAMINRYYILDLQPDRSVVKKYLESGIDVYMIDWGDPLPADKYESIGDLIRVVDEFVDVVRKRSGAEAINIQGYCMGGTFATIYAAQYPSKVNSLFIQAAPIDFATRDGILYVWAKDIDADKIVDTYGNVPSSFLNSSFLLVNPVRLMVDKYVKYQENLSDKDYVENFERMEKWIFDSPDLPGEVYRQFIKDLYQNNLLAKNQLTINGRSVDLKKITMPFLNLVGKDDNLVVPESSEPMNDLISSNDKELMIFPSGHIGLSVSGKAHRDLWPKVIDWILKNSEKSSKERKEQKKKL